MITVKWVHRVSFLLIATVFFVYGSSQAYAQLKPPTGKMYGGSNPESKKLQSGIGWFGVLEDGLKEAKRTGKPILLVSAAPQCNGVPGMW